MTAGGIDTESQARALGMSIEQLTVIYAAEIENAVTKINTQIMGALARNALSGNLGAQIFWLKTRAGWKDVSIGDDGSRTSYQINITAKEKPARLRLIEDDGGAIVEAGEEAAEPIAAKAGGKS